MFCLILPDWIHDAWGTDHQGLPSRYACVSLTIRYTTAESCNAIFALPGLANEAGQKGGFPRTDAADDADEATSGHLQHNVGQPERLLDGLLYLRARIWFLFGFLTALQRTAELCHRPVPLVRLGFSRWILGQICLMHKVCADIDGEDRIDVCIEIVRTLFRLSVSEKESSSRPERRNEETGPTTISSEIRPADQRCLARPLARYSRLALIRFAQVANIRGSQAIGLCKNEKN